MSKISKHKCNGFSYGQPVQVDIKAYLSPEQYDRFKQKNIEYIFYVLDGVEYFEPKMSFKHSKCSQDIKSHVA